MRRQIILAAFAFAGIACGGQLDRPAQTTSTSGRMSRPDTSQSSSRTVDSTGFVDNSGMTSDQRGRTEASGMRGTEAGSDRPTGTPGSGTPVPIEPTSPRPTGEPGVGTDVEAQIGRFAEARCDWEAACGRVGAGKSHESKHACTQNVRTVVQREIEALDCAQGHDSLHVGLCLTAIRGASCSRANDVFHTNEDCRASVVCAY